MCRFNYIIIPTLFLMNMGADAATITNALTFGLPIPFVGDSGTQQASGVASLQNRQFRGADFSSDPTTPSGDEPALSVEDLPGTDHQARTLPPHGISRSQFLSRGRVYPSLAFGDDGLSTRGDRPAINFRQPLRRADAPDTTQEGTEDLSLDARAAGDDVKDCRDVASPQRRLDSGLSTNALSDISFPMVSDLPAGSPLASDSSTSDSPASDSPASSLPISNLAASSLPASNLPADSLPADSSLSNAVGTSNLMTSALGSGGIQDEVSHLASRYKPSSHGMGAVTEDGVRDGLESRQLLRSRQRKHSVQNSAIAVPSIARTMTRAVKRQDEVAVGEGLVEGEPQAAVTEGLKNVQTAGTTVQNLEAQFEGSMVQL